MERLVSSAPSLEQLSFTNSESSWENLLPVIPDNLFGGIAPRLVYLRLDNCGIRWESPFLKGLRDLELYLYPERARTTLNTWLDALNQMPQLERLSLHNGIPIYSRLPVEPGLAVILSSLTELDLSTSPHGCLVVLAHLILPALSRLSVNTETDRPTGRDARPLIPYVTRNAHGPQDTEALQSLFIGGDTIQAYIIAWTIPREDTNIKFPISFDVPYEIPLARVAFSTSSKSWYDDDMYILLHGKLLTAPPLNPISSLTVKGHRPLTREVWDSLAPKWLKLQCLRLFSTAVPALGEMLEDAPPRGPLLPSLEELVLINVSLDVEKVHYLRYMIIKLVELRVPLRALDLRMCLVGNRAIQLLGEIMVNMQGPEKRESGDIDRKRRGNFEVLTEEARRFEDEDGFDIFLPFLASWDTNDDDDDDDDDTSSTD